MRVINRHGVDLRCTAAHPTIEDWECRRFLALLAPGTRFVMERATEEDALDPDVARVRCDRCGTWWALRLL